MPGLNQFDPGGDPFAPVPTPGTVTVALDMTLGPPLVSLAQPQGGTMEAGATEWLLCQVTLSDLGSGFPVDPKQYAVSLAVTQSDPSPSDFQAGEWLQRSAEPAGAYAMLLVGPAAPVAPGVGHWRVYVQVQAGGETLEGRAPGTLTIE